jgi:hypothetical protein
MIIFPTVLRSLLFENFSRRHEKVTPVLEYHHVTGNIQELFCIEQSTSELVIRR